MKRRKMQKLIAGVMCGLMIASLTGCSGSSGAGNSDAEVKSTAPVVSEQALIFLSPRFDRELAPTDQAPAAQIPGKA